MTESRLDGASLSAFLFWGCRTSLLGPPKDTANSLQRMSESCAMSIWILEGHGRFVSGLLSMRCGNLTNDRLDHSVRCRTRSPTLTSYRYEEYSS